MSTLVKTIDGNGFPNIYIYKHKGEFFGVAKTWRSPPAGWNVSRCDFDAKWGENIGLASTRKEAIALAVAQIDWDARPGVSPTELKRLIEMEPSR